MNRLAGAASPYLRQHADNPVDWWPWIPEAFAEAKQRNVPVHLSIGYAACHWCHVMARESFSNPATAEILNRDFVSIKVDREERPEVDQIYMRALHALGEQGGWPLTMFLTPEGEPFWGGTYFPPEPRWGRPSFRQILGGVSSAWQSGDAAITTNATALRQHLNRPSERAGEGPAPQLLDQAARSILSAWDMQRGSFKGAPKFPNAVVLSALWRTHLRTRETSYRDAVLITLTSLCQGGIYDHVGGGLARYATDAGWKVPHFEKMLYDNGLFLTQLAHAHRATSNQLFHQRISETVGWLLREMRMPSRAFASSLDADTEHEEGLTYVWTWDELGSELDNELTNFARLYDVKPEGNWEDGKNILHRLAGPGREWLGDEEEARLRSLLDRLLAKRNTRPQPDRDDKILTDWNGLAISGLANAAAATNDDVARRAAIEAFGAIVRTMTEGDRLAHSSLDGERVFPGVATDYANMIRASIDLFALTGEGTYIDRAEAWFAAADRHHFDTDSSAYDLVASDAPPLIAKPLSITDEATPAATGIMAENAATLFMLTGAAHYRQRAEAVLGHLSTRAESDIVGTASLQSAFDTLLRGRLALVLGSGVEADALVAAALGEADSALVVAKVGADAIRSGHPAEGKRPSGAAAMFLCDALRCLPEIVAPEEARTALRETRRGLA
jgi:uncharacterized protein